MKLEIYQTETIKNVLNECFGLQKLLKKYFEEKNENLLNESLTILSSKTGFRKEFLKENIQEIINI